eukprot:739882-Amphidinium_carterae.1
MNGGLLKIIGNISMHHWNNTCPPLFAAHNQLHPIIDSLYFRKSADESSKGCPLAVMHSLRHALTMHDDSA